MRTEELIERAEGVLEVLKLSKVNLGAPAALLETARERLSARDYGAAESLAAQAERLGTVLEERYRAAKEALRIARAQLAKLNELGLDATALEGAIADARRTARTSAREEGVDVPDYARAQEILEAATVEARVVRRKSEEASNAVFTAELALEALREMNGHMDPEVFERKVLSGIEARIEHATELLALANMDEALEVAKDAERRASRARVDYAACIAAADDTERVLGDLRAEGAIIPSAERDLEAGTASLRKGSLAEARVTLERTQREALNVANQYRKSVAGVEELDLRLSELHRQGFRSEEADEALREARRSLREGRYAKALDFVDDGARAIRRHEEVHEHLSKALQDTKEKLVELRGLGLDTADDVEEMLARAEREFENGDYVNSSEDLKIATLLIGPAARALMRPERTPEEPSP